MEKKYVIGNVYETFKEFRDYDLDKVEESFRNTDFIPLVAYIQEGRLYFYFIKEVKSEISTKEIKDIVYAFKRLSEIDGEDVIPTIDLTKKIEFYSKKDLELMNKIIITYEKEGFIRVIENNIDRIVKDKTPLKFEDFRYKINGFEI